MGGEGCAAARTVELDLEALVNQVLLEKGVQCPPDRLDVIVFTGDIGPFHVDPVAHSECELFPYVLVFKNALSAFCVKSVDAVFLDFFFVFDPKPTFYLDLDREAMRVPTCLSMDLVSAHGLVATYEVFDRP